MTPSDIFFAAELFKLLLQCALIAAAGWLSFLGLEWLSHKSEQWHERKLRRMPGRIAELQPRRR
jgi:hypothetical protein